MSELNLEEKLEVAMDSFNGAMNSVLIILEEKQKLKEEKQELLKKVKDFIALIKYHHGECDCEYRNGARCPNCQQLHEAKQLIKKYEEGENE